MAEKVKNESRPKHCFHKWCVTGAAMVAIAAGLLEIGTRIL